MKLQTNQQMAAALIFLAALEAFFQELDPTDDLYVALFGVDPDPADDKPTKVLKIKLGIVALKGLARG